MAAEFGAGPGWFRVEAPLDRATVATLRLLVDFGEAEAIPLGVKRGLRVLLNDRQARSVALRFSVSMLGAVSVLLRAKQAGVLQVVRSELSALEANGFYLAPALRVEMLN